LDEEFFFHFQKVFFKNKKKKKYFSGQKNFLKIKKKIPNSKKNNPRMNFFNKINNIVKIINILYFSIFDCRKKRLLFKKYFFIVFYCNILIIF
jgi:hypothetical protein